MLPKCPTCGRTNVKCKARFVEGLLRGDSRCLARWRAAGALAASLRMEFGTGSKRVRRQWNAQAYQAAVRKAFPDDDPLVVAFAKAVKETLEAPR